MSAPSEDLIVAKTQEIMKSVTIPSCPKTLLQLNVEMRQEHVNLGPVADIVGQDVGLTARVLKIANSPMFGSRIEIDSIMVALNRLGLRNFRNAVVAGSLKECMGESTPQMERFWAHSEAVAMLSQKIAQSLCPSIVESSYLAGLFHDCGIPLMLKKFPAFTEQFPLALSPQREALLEEEKKYGTNHAVAGFLVARTWQLSAAITEAVREHHFSATFSSLSQDAKMLVGVVQLAERLEARRAEPNRPLFADQEKEARQHVFEALLINDAGLQELAAEIGEWLAQKK